MTPRNRVLVLDDDSAVRRTLRRFLEGKGYQVVEAATIAEAVTVIASERPDAAVLDYMLPDGTALELMAQLRTAEPDLPVAILTGHGTIELAVRAIKEGAEHFLTKPVQLAALSVVLERMLENARTRHHVAARQRRLRGRPDPFLGTSALIHRLREDAEKIVATDTPILILGETGTGKGVLARWLHDNGPRCKEAIVDLNCSSLSRELLESELFGHEKGSFTGAVGTKKGLFEVAHRGTLFLDEIADMALDVQPRLLTVLEDLRFRRLGDVRDRVVDVRLIAATHQDLQDSVKAGRFRADLYYRISTLPLTIPALRERREDIPILAQHLLDSLLMERGGSEVRLGRAAIEQLSGYAWPGNIRELRNVLERALLLSSGGELSPRDLRFDRATAPAAAAPPTSSQTLEELERDHIQRVLTEEGGRVATAAERLGIPRSTLYKKIRTYGLGDDPGDQS